LDKLCRRVLTFILIVLLQCTTFYAMGAEETSQVVNMDTMDQLSEQVLKLTEQGKFVDAKQKLDQLSSLYTQIGAEKKISIEALAVVTEAVIEAKKSFAAVHADKSEMLENASKLRLITDAITHPNQPIWKGYHTKFSSQISQLLVLTEKGAIKPFNTQLQENMKLYNVLKPCFAINQTPQTIEMMDSIYNFLDKRVDIAKPDWSAIRNSLDHLRQVSDNVFLGKEQNTLAFYNNNSPITMIAIMSTILLSVLSYVGWKMYHGTRYNV
jgi:sporulation protein YpjB